MDGDGQHHAGLLLAHSEHSVADMLAADAYHVAAALCRIEPKRQRQAGAPSCFKLLDLGFRPCVVTIRLWYLEFDAEGRIVADELSVETPPEKMAEGLKPIQRRMRWHGVNQSNNKFLWQRRQCKVAVVLIS